MSVKFNLLSILCRVGAFFAFSLGVTAQTNQTNALIPSGGEFSVLGSVPGDQVLPSLSLNSSGGVIAWQDNVLDKSGTGIGGALLGNNFQAGAEFRANHVATGDQIKPQVQLLANDRILFVWQCNVAGVPHIYARFARNSERGATGYNSNFYTADIRVNTYLKDQQVDPAVTGLADGSAMVTWSSYGEDGSLWGVYARHIGVSGGGIPQKKGEPATQFLVNQFTTGNQRSPAIAALANGNVVICWVSERERSTSSFDIYARIFTSAGVPVTDELPINTSSNLCATPSVAPLNDGGFTVVWGEQDQLVATNSWDIWGRAFSSSGIPDANQFRINTFLVGDQYTPKIASGSAGCMVVWTSMAQDGYVEGVFGRFLAGGLQPYGSELQVNTTVISKQMHPAVAWNGTDRFLVVWTSFVGAAGFDLYGQAYTVGSIQ